MTKHGVWALIGILGLILVITLAFPTEGICASKPSTLKMGWSEGPQAGMNPFLARNEGDYVFMSLLYEPLVIPLMTLPLMLPGCIVAARRVRRYQQELAVFEARWARDANCC